VTPPAPFSLRRIAIPAFGPSVLFGTATGAMMPVIALRAAELGASPALAGFMAALVGLGGLVSNLPAALLTARIGERKAILAASALGVFAGLLCLAVEAVWWLALGVVLLGAVSAVFMLARQGYLTERVPLGLRARALSTLGGSSRIGVFIGPFLAAGFIHVWGLRGAFWVVVAAMLATGALTLAYPDLPAIDADKGTEKSADKPANNTARATTLLHVLRSHASVLRTLGVGVMLVMMLRACRQVAIPLWGTHIGIAPATVTLIYGLTAAVDMLAFYPAGSIMDRYGRLWIALPSSLTMGVALVLMPLIAASPASYVAVCLLLGLGNGISSGLVMTLAADAAPPHARPQFLGLWRLLGDTGACSGPFILSALTAGLSLAAGIACMGLTGLAAAAVFWRWLPHGRLPAS